MPSNSLNDNPGCLSLFNPSKKKKNSASTSSGEQTSSLYSLNESFLTPAEMSFFDQAGEVLSDQYVICPKVALPEMIKVVASDPSQRQSAQNRIFQKRVDFVVCAADTMKMLFAIELDDISHAQPERQARDQFMDRLFASIGLPLIHVTYRPDYSHQELIEILFAPLQPKKSAPALQPAQTSTGRPVPPPLPKKSAEAAEVRCPKCGAPMKKRSATQGVHQGQVYSVCSNYPQCPTFYPSGEGKGK